jgi:Oxidoreductase NAD-binding domain
MRLHQSGAGGAPRSAVRARPCALSLPVALFQTCVSGSVQEILATYPDQFRVDYALSREMKNKEGGKMYIQNKMEEYADEIFDLLDQGAHIYFCGLKGARPAVCQCCCLRDCLLCGAGLQPAAACRCQQQQRWRCSARVVRAHALLRGCVHAQRVFDGGVCCKR